MFLIKKLSSDDINHINFDLFGRLLKFVFTFLILLIIWVLLFSKTGHWTQALVSGNFFYLDTIYPKKFTRNKCLWHWRRKWVSSSTPVLHNLQILSSVFTPIYLPFSISRLWALTLNLVSTLLSSSFSISRIDMTTGIDRILYQVQGHFLDTPPEKLRVDFII